eukprot:816209-Prorocentrum_minimum.AAC.2
MNPFGSCALQVGRVCGERDRPGARTGVAPQHHGEAVGRQAHERGAEQRARDPDQQEGVQGGLTICRSPDPLQSPSKPTGPDRPMGGFTEHSLP